MNILPLLFGLLIGQSEGADRQTALRAGLLTRRPALENEAFEVRQRVFEGLPWPEGEPGALTAAAGKLRAIAGRLSAAGSPLAAAAGLGGWSGEASIASSLLLSAQTQSVQGAAEVFGATATALSGLATLLSAGQDRIRVLAREVRAAREAAEAAQHRAADAAQRMSANPDSTGLEGAYLHLDAAAGQAQQHYREVRDRAMRQAHEIVAECEAADADTASEVAEGKIAATAGPNGLPAGASQVDIEPVALAWLYAPHIRFHPDERYLPSDIRAALARTTLRTIDGRTVLDLPDDFRPKGSTSAPVDFSVVQRDGKTYLMYRVWYSYNDKGLDDHEGDLELFGVELGADGKPAAALYYGHGTPHRVPGPMVSGRTRQNKLVHLAGGPELVGRLVNVRVEHAGPYALRGSAA